MTQNNKDDVLCRIWAWEENPENGTGHHCHVALHGFKGGYIIKRILKEF